MISQEEQLELERVVRAAGAELLSFWPGNPSHHSRALDTKSKSDGSLVSQADLASNEILMRGLGRLFPKDLIHSEEIPPSPEICQARRLWVIDPLDGTGVFLQGKDEFCILLALLLDGYPELGMMYFPARDLFVHAMRGEGAYCNGERIQVSASKEISQEGAYCRLLQLEDETKMFPSHLDSGHALYRLACGMLDAVAFRLQSLREWDLAAPTIIIEEAGGRVSNGQGKAMSYLPGSLPELFVASNSQCHEELLESLRLLPEAS